MAPVNINFRRRSRLIIEQQNWREKLYDSDSEGEEEEDEDDLSSLSASVDYKSNDELNTTTGTRSSIGSKERGRDLTVDTSKSNNNNNTSNNNIPPTPWGSSSSKIRIINELSDPTSDIHLCIGLYTETNFKNVNFQAILQKYAGNKYKPNLFRENLKNILIHFQKKTGPFKDRQQTKVEPWYTSVNNVSKAYSLLFSLHMNDATSCTLACMSAEEIWRSDPLFQQYKLEKFKDYLKSMEKRTSSRKKYLQIENEAYYSDMKKLPRNEVTSRGYPFWDTHEASKLLAEDEESGKAKRLKPMELWKSRKEYQDFPPTVFRKHIYQLRSKQLAAPFWQHKRNKNAKEKYEETENLLKEWQVIKMCRDFSEMTLL